ncbi:hypothetical protein AAY473_009841 [Plecturocebus cupreus]
MSKLTKRRKVDSLAMYIFYLFIYLFEIRVLTVLSRLECSGTISAHLQPLLPRFKFHHVGQAGLKLLTSGDPPICAPQSAGVTVVSHCVQPIFLKCILQEIKVLNFFHLHTSKGLTYHITTFEIRKQAQKSKSLTKGTQLRLSPKELGDQDIDSRASIMIKCHLKEGKNSLPRKKTIKVPNLAKLPVQRILPLSPSSCLEEASGKC